MEQLTTALSELQIDNLYRLRDLNGYVHFDDNIHQNTTYKIAYYEAIDFMRQNKVWIYVVIDCTFNNPNQMSIRLDQPFDIVLR